MIKKLPSGAVWTKSHQCPVTGRFFSGSDIWFTAECIATTLPWHFAFLLEGHPEHRKYREIPVKLLHYHSPETRVYWNYQGNFYVEDESLTPEQFKARMIGPGGREQAGSKRPRLSDDVKIFVWRRDEGRCVKCGSRADLEYDHVIPLSLGGSNTARNIELLCAKCNRAKGADIA